MTLYSLIPELPTNIDVEPTIRCNFSCVMCQRTYWTRKAPDMSLAEFRHVYDCFPKLNYIKIQGVGEPLLNTSLFEMIRYAKQHGSHVTTFTNGSLLHVKNNANRLLDSGIDLIRISMDGGRKETYENIRRRSNFKQVVQNTAMLSNLRRGAHSPRIELWVVGMPQNVQEIPAIVDFASQAEIDAVRIQIILNTFDYKVEVKDRLMNLRLQQHNESAFHLQKGIEYAEEHNVPITLFASKVYTGERHCHRPFGSLYVSVEGDVVPCPTIGDPTVVRMGNVFKEDIQGIWQSNQYQAFRRTHVDGNLNRPCRNCYLNSNRALHSSIDSRYFKDGNMSGSS